MKLRFLFLVSLLMGFCLASHAAWLTVNSPIADQVPTVGIQEQSPSSWQIDVSIPGFDVESVTEDGHTFQRLSLPNELMGSGDGEAELPIISRAVGLRFEGNPELEVVSEEWMDLEGTYDLVLDAQDARAVEMAGSYAIRDEYLPNDSYGVTSRQVMGGVSLSVLYIRPAKYNPAQRKVQVLKNVELRIHEQGSPLPYDRPITETTASILRAVVPNWDEISLNLNIVRGTLLYIVANSTTVQTEIENFVTWRHRKGYAVEVAGPDEIGSMTTTNIKAYIQNRYRAADPPLEFVCLVGDADGSPSLPAYSYTSGSYTGAGDYGYTQLDGNDLLPDVAIGRLCFNSIGELDVILNKTFYYEREPAPATGGSHPSWYKGASLLAGNTSSWNSGISTVQLMRWIRERAVESGFTSSSIDTLYYIHQSVTAYYINNSINSGVTLLSYRGLQFFSDYDASDIASLTNGRRLPFMAIVTCNTNDFNTDDGTASICEYLVKAGTIATPKGAIGAIGTSSPGTHVQYNNCICGGIFQGLLREGIRTMGGSLARSKLELHVNYPVDSLDVRFFCGISTLIGDPAVDIFTDTPDTLHVDNPASVPVGTNTLTLTVTNQDGQAVSDAYVNLVKDTEVFVGDWTNSSGQVILHFTTSSAESLFVTASKHNCRPAINYTLVTTNPRFVSPPSSTFVLDDDNSGESSGNADGVANPGETIELPVSLKNWGTSTATGVQADLSISDPSIVSITHSHVSYGDIASGATVAPPEDFVFIMASYVHDAHLLHFTLTVTDGTSDTWISGIPVLVCNGELEYIGTIISGAGDGVLDPGESGEMQLKLLNVGSASVVAGNTGYLRSGSPALTITDSIGTFNGAPPGQRCDNMNDLFGVSAASYAIVGDRIPLTCIFPLSNGFADTVLFKLPIGTVASTTPTPPDSYGYWAFDDTDVGYGKHPTYSWVEIDGRYGGPGTQLNIYDYNDEDDATAVVSLPFTFKYYGQDFTQISVCSNGWLAMGAEQAIHTDFRNWTIPGALGPEAMIAPFWDDLYRISYNGSYGRIYTYHDAANHRFIVQWSRVQKHGGSNPTETFQCILYQPGFPATPTGDGEILFQYMTCVNTYDVSTSNDYATVGIENLNETDGTLYSYWNIAAPGAATMTSGRAILFTTQKIPPTIPKSPTKLSAIRSGGDVQLRWNAVHEDLFENPITVSQYKVYRDVSPDFTPGAGNYLGTASDTTYLDAAATSGAKYFYVVQAYLSAAYNATESESEAVER